MVTGFQIFNDALISCGKDKPGGICEDTGLECKASNCKKYKQMWKRECHKHIQNPNILFG